MKRLSIVTAIALVIAMAAANSYGSWVTVWDDDHTGSTLNENWTKSSAGNPNSAEIDTDNDWLAITSGPQMTAWVNIAADTDEAGTMTEWQGAELYNFFNHAVRVTMDLASLEGTPVLENDSVRTWFAIGEPGVPGGGRDNQYGFNIEKLSDGDGGFWWRLDMEMSADGGRNRTTLGITGEPSAMVYTLDGTNVTVSLTGATFDDAEGGSERSFDFEGALFAETFTDYNINLGTRNNLSGEDGEETTVANYDTFKVEVIPEPGTLAMLGLGTIGIMLFRRRLRKA